MLNYKISQNFAEDFTKKLNESSDDDKKFQEIAIDACDIIRGISTKMYDAETEIESYQLWQAIEAIADTLRYYYARK